MLSHAPIPYVLPTNYLASIRLPLNWVRLLSFWAQYLIFCFVIISFFSIISLWGGFLGLGGYFFLGGKGVLGLLWLGFGLGVAAWSSW